MKLISKLKKISICSLLSAGTLMPLANVGLSAMYPSNAMNSVHGTIDEDFTMDLEEDFSSDDDDSSSDIENEKSLIKEKNSELENRCFSRDCKDELFEPSSKKPGISSSKLKTFIVDENVRVKSMSNEEKTD